MTKMVCAMVNFRFITAKGESIHPAFDREVILALKDTHLIEVEYGCKDTEQYRGPGESNGHLIGSTADTE